MEENGDLRTRIAVLEERIRNDQKAIALQALEYERRLAELNHAHEKQVEDQATYVSFDKFDGLVARVVVNENKLSTVAGEGIGKTVVQSTVFNVLPIVLSIVSVVVTVWLAIKKF